MRDEDGLGALEVRVGRHDSLAGVGGYFGERGKPAAQLGDGDVDGEADVEAEVGGDLLVARAAVCGA